MSMEFDSLEQKLKNRAFLVELANTKMPFGRYEGRYLIDLPLPYLTWFAQKGFPKGKLGEMLEITYVVKDNNIEGLIKTIQKF